MLNKKNIAFLILFFSYCLSYSINDSLINLIEFKANKSEKGNVYISLNGTKLTNNIKANWLYFNYDNNGIKSNTLKDSAFRVITQTCMYFIDEDPRTPSGPNEIEFNGIAWYKLYFKMPLKQINKVYSFTYSQMGASEIYLDGRLLKSFGKIDQKGKTISSKKIMEDNISYFVGDTLVHTIAIRYSFSDYEALYKKFNQTEIGPYLVFNTSNNEYNDSKFLNVFYSGTSMLAAFFIALFLIHLLIFLFYREKTFHLYYSLFLLFLALSFFEIYFLRFIEDPRTYLWVAQFDDIFFPACCFFLVTLFNRLLNVKRSKHYIFLLIVFVLLILNTIFFGNFEDGLIITIVCYTYFNTLAHSIVGIRKKIPSAKFLGWGILSFTISILVAILLGFLIATVFANSALAENLLVYLLIIDLIISILSVPISMTAYLAFDFANTNKSLVQQLNAIDALNKKSIEQEKEKQEILENQNKFLETQVTERTKEIGEQNKVLEHQKKEITDSINYAKRIQQALLPELESIKKAIPNSFVYYLPKDIVSGDFYYFNEFSGTADHPGRKGKEEPGTFIAAADCTGHGVPGALMSMIVHEKLEAAIKIHNQPDEILHSINKQVKDALKQHQTDASRDGCDIALCKIQGNTLSYAGAYRPLYLFYKNGDFVEVKATKTAIAGLTPYNQKFEQYQFNISDLKAVYMFSDGYADQFGGQNSKKLTTKKFKELLKIVVNLPVNDQNLQLETFFKGWKGNVEQIDDVLVIGITF
ncbi:MAG TPA: SpoIIE family protein phosphatase [Bacteroidia bacterium]|jgi:serine phosphatase RsbU (regulator of sigma subunit)|nr:SpoIIE family protein phosphatase [Bacteroidia bacterium]